MSKIRESLYLKVKGRVPKGVTGSVCKMGSGREGVRERRYVK